MAYYLCHVLICFNKLRRTKKALVEKDKYNFLTYLDKSIIIEISNILESFSNIFDMLERSSVNLHLVLPYYFTSHNHLQKETFSNECSNLTSALSQNLDLKYEGYFSSYQIVACWSAPYFSDFRFCSNQTEKSEYILVDMEAVKNIAITLNETTTNL